MSSTAAMRRMAYARVNLDFESRQLGKALMRIPPEIRKKVVRKGLREWGKRALRAMRRRIKPSDPEMRRDGIVKLKTYKRGKVFWAGVGVRKDNLGSGWRAHFWNNGFRVWQKGLRKDGTPLLPESVSHGWMRLARCCGMPGIRLHDARHSHASLLLKQNVHPKIVSERLGHAARA